jgi:hypothetical protein
MTIVNQVFFPFVLFVAYYYIAVWCVHEPLTLPPEIPAPLVVKVLNPSTNSKLHILTPPDVKISREWLNTLTHRNLKAIASELSIEVIGDRRFKNNYIDVILDRDC